MSLGNLPTGLSGFSASKNIVPLLSAGRLALFAAAFCLAFGLSIGGAAMAAPATALPSTVETAGGLPVARPDYPVPTDGDLLFYIQRSTNPNTVVYSANFLPDGRLDPKQPIAAFWRRFNTSGERKALGFMEKRMAYGMRFKATATPGQYEIWFVSLPDRPALLVQKKPGAAELRMRLGNYEVKPVYAYVTVNEGGLFGSVEQIAVHGIDRASGKAVTEIIPVSGARIGP